MSIKRISIYATCPNQQIETKNSSLISLNINYPSISEEALLKNNLKFKFPVCETFIRGSIHHFNNPNVVTRGGNNKSIISWELMFIGKREKEDIGKCGMIVVASR